MPDQDRIERSLHQRWRRAYRQIKGRQPVEMVAGDMVRALADQLRSEGGLPAFAEFVTIATFRGDGRGRAHTVGEAVRKLEQRLAHRGIAKAEARAALIVWAKVAAGDTLPGPTVVAEECCWQVLETCLTGKLDSLVGKKGPFANILDLESYRRQLRTALAPIIYDLAQQLAREPASATIRAPRPPRRKRTTRELLDMPVIVAER